MALDAVVSNFPGDVLLSPALAGGMTAAAEAWDAALPAERQTESVTWLLLNLSREKDSTL